MTAPLPESERIRFLWTAEADAMALRMAADGYSRFAIGIALGIGKNAVIGRLNRLRLKKAPPKKRTPTKHTVERRAMSGLTYGLPKFADTAPVTFDLPTDTAVRLRDVRPFDCRWPLGDPRGDDFMFCGAAAHDGPYCIGHARLAYRRAA